MSLIVERAVCKLKLLAEKIDPLVISDLLLSDKHDLVQKVYGWMLKSLSQVDVDTITHYLIDNHDKMPRTAYRYALKKYEKETINKLMMSL